MRICAFLLIALFVTGCDSSVQNVDGFFKRLNQEWNALGIVLTGGESPLARHPEKSVSPARSLSPSEAAERAKQNSQLLQEVLRVVYDREPDNRAEFGTLLDSMNQGASIEGLYNGFTHSSEYRKLEAATPGATPAALSFFAGELAETEALLSTPTEFSAESARPLALPVQPMDTGVNEVSYTAPSPSPSKTSMGRQEIQALKQKYSMIFTGASIFTLKRVLSDEMLRLIDELSKNPAKLQSWYGDWVARMCTMGVDFGLPLRNKGDAAFHTVWAKTADPDRLRWEVLNRVHRILNERNRPQPAASPVSGGRK